MTARVSGPPAHGRRTAHQRARSSAGIAPANSRLVVPVGSRVSSVIGRRLLASRRCTQIGAMDEILARAAVESGIRRYFADRRTRVRPFVDRHFSLSGTLALHRAALGPDIL